MKALTLTQPWATLVAIGAKRIETRSWKTDYRGELAIHAAKSWSDDDRDCCWDRAFREALEPTELVDYGAYEDLLPEAAERYQAVPLGAIIAVCTLVDVVPSERVEPSIDYAERQFGNYGPRRFAWKLADVRSLKEPVPIKGALSVWPVPSTFEALVRAQLVAA